eukprot:1427038-Rhodomonas_salina.1
MDSGRQRKTDRQPDSQTEKGRARGKSTCSGASFAPQTLHRVLHSPSGAHARHTLNTNAPDHLNPILHARPGGVRVSVDIIAMMMSVVVLGSCQRHYCGGSVVSGIVT